MAQQFTDAGNLASNLLVDESWCRTRPHCFYGEATFHIPEIVKSHDCWILDYTLPKEYLEHEKKQLF
jgi:hypothetical protein